LEVFKDQIKNLEVGQEAEAFPINDHLSLLDLKGSPIFLVFWKTL
jgi:hypothetical protein